MKLHFNNIAIHFHLIQKWGVLDFLTILIIAYGLGESTGVEFRIIMLLLELAWVIVDIVQKQGKILILKNDNSAILLVTFLVVYFGLCFISTDTILALKYGMAYTIYFLLLVIGNYYIVNDDKVKIRLLCELSINVLTFYSIVSIIFYLQNPGAGRVIAANRESFGRIIIGGGYDLAYILAIVSPVLVIEILKHQRTILNLMRLVLFVFTMILTGSFLTLMLAVMGCLISFYISISNKYLRVLIAMIFSVIAFLVLYSSLDIIISRTGGKIYDSVAVRINEVARILKGEKLGQNSAFGQRIFAYTKNTEILKTHPFIGGMYDFGVLQTRYATDSTYISALLCWGILLGGIFVLGHVIKGIKLYRIPGAMFVCLIMPLVNSMFSVSYYLGLFIIIPWLDYYYSTDNFTNK